MPKPHPLLKAMLIKISLKEDYSVSMGLPVIPVQFNPESLQVSRSRDASGKTVSTLTVTLWYDVTQLGLLANIFRDVQLLTVPLRVFLKPGAPLPRVSGVRFLWGTFLFDGWIESMTENYDYFSAEGMPVRASVSLTITDAGMKKGGAIWP